MNPVEFFSSFKDEFGAQREAGAKSLSVIDCRL